MAMYRYNASYVYIMYCSSDQFIGDGVQHINGDVWQFRGTSIINNTIAFLIQQYDLMETKNILWSGCSAGGQGVVNTLDIAHDYLREVRGRSIYEVNIEM
tara:strand:- start:1217 stop:1516 length:300 start_codon:yes stop_codon:yes gene_type:complete